MWASTSSDAKNVDASKYQEARISNSEEELMGLPSIRRKDTPLSLLSGNAIVERNLICRTRDLKQSKPIEEKGPLSTTDQYSSQRRNTIYSQEPAMEIENSTVEGKEYKVEVTKSYEVCSPIANDNNSFKENENWVAKSTDSTWCTPNGAQGPTLEKTREVNALYAEGNSLQSTKKALFQTENTVSQAVLYPKSCDSETQEEIVREKLDTKVLDENIDSGIEHIENEIIRLAQKLADLKLKKANCEAQSQPVDVNHDCGKTNVPMEVANVEEIKNSTQQETSERKKRGKIIAAKFHLSDSYYQTKCEQNLAETNLNRKINTVKTTQIQRTVASGSKTIEENEGKFETHDDKVGKKLSPKETDLLKETMKETHPHERFNMKENMSQTLRPITSGKKLCFCTDSKPKEVTGKTNNLSMQLKSKGIGPLQLEKKTKFLAHSKSKEVITGNKQERNSSTNGEGKRSRHENCKKFPELLDKKNSQKLSVNDPDGHCIKINSSNQVGKVSPSTKLVRIVPSRYGQIVTPKKDASSQSPSKFNYLRNMHGKRISSEVEADDVKAGVDICASKRTTVSHVAGSSSLKDLSLRNQYPTRYGLVMNSKTPNYSTVSLIKTQSSATSNSRTTQISARRFETKKTTATFIEDDKNKSKLTRQGHRSRKQQDLHANLTEMSIGKPLDPIIQNSYKGCISSINREKINPECPGQSSVASQFLDSLGTEKKSLPKISTFKFTAK